VERVGRPRAGRIPAGGFVLSGSGDAAEFLRGSLEAGEAADIELGMGEGQALVTGGGPRLLVRGRVAVAATAEGFAPLSAPGFVASRHPRTLAGVKRDGTLLFVTVDGRRPGWSAGVTLPEAAHVMRSLGARNALNLDGGGSSGMVVRGELVSRPSDPSGERAVSDGIFVLP
jgi:Phosphodiester glycosidase